jgi:hypothetical protein
MFLEALVEGSPKTYDTPPSYGDQKVSVVTKKVIEKFLVA